MGKELALVKWLSGEDEGKYTAGLPLDWIRHFKLEKFRNEEYTTDQPFVTEWRSGKKMPAGGWPLYDILVIEVSDNLKQLERKIELLSLVRSPKQPHTKTAVEVRTSPRKPKTSLFSSSSSKVTKSGGAVQTSSESKMSEKRKFAATPEKKKSAASPEKRKRAAGGESTYPHRRAEKKGLDFDGNGLDEMRTMSGIGNLPDDTDVHCQGCNYLETVKTALDDMSKKMDSLTKEVLSFKKRQSQPQQPCEAEPKRPSSDSSFTLKEPKAEPGTSAPTITVADVLVDGQEMKRVTSGISTCTFTKQSWETAEKANTAPAMTAALVVGGFPLAVLLESTYKGGAAKVGLNKGKPSKPLDGRIVGVIKAAVKRRYPQFSDALLGTAINNKLSMIKSKHTQNAMKCSSSGNQQKAPNKRRYIESDEEEEDENSTNGGEKPNNQDDASGTIDMVSSGFTSNDDNDNSSVGSANDGNDD